MTPQQIAEAIVRGWHVSDGFPHLTDAIAAALEEKKSGRYIASVKDLTPQPDGTHVQALPGGAFILNPTENEERIRLAYVAALEEKERVRHSGCPCLLVEPCSYACSCANPIMSGGCTRCARYGSENQRRQMAQHLAELPNALEEKDREIERLRESLNGSVRVGESIAGKLVIAEQQLAEAVKLLEPFAGQAESIDGDSYFRGYSDDREIDTRLGWCRAAAAFVAKHKGQP